MNSVSNENYSGGYYDGGTGQKQQQYSTGTGYGGDYNKVGSVREDGYRNEYGGDGGYGQAGGNFGQTTATAARPLVDPNATGEVDMEKYPEPKDSTKKIRGISGFLDTIFGPMPQELLLAKTFYFFFYSAFGSLFPLMGVYFKQLGFNPTQCGVIMGLRPFVEFLSTPFWGGVADRYRRGKVMLIGSLACWIIFTLPIGFIQPTEIACKVFNQSHFLIEDAQENTNVVRRKRSGGGISDVPPYDPDEIAAYAGAGDGISGRYNNDDVLPGYSLPARGTAIDMNSVDELDYFSDGETALEVSSQQAYDRNIEVDDGLSTQTGNDRSPQGKSSRRVRRAAVLIPDRIAGKSPERLTHAVNYNKEKHSQWVSPPYSSLIFRLDDIKKVFFLLLLLVVIGEFLSAPAITLADSAVLTYLGDEPDLYGHQRMFGSVGWGIAMFFVGIALDNSTSFTNRRCTRFEREKNYTICFAVFSVLMGCALMTATQFIFNYDLHGTVGITRPLNGPPANDDQDKQKVQSQYGEPQITLEAETDATTGQFAPKIGKTQVFAQRLQREMPEWMAVLKHFASVKCASFLFVAWFMGFGIGLIFTFLFWHLQDFEGSPTLFGVASVINHISEIFAYFFSYRLIKQLGHVKVLCLGLAGNVLRFLYISWLKTPWWVLPFEFIQGITHAAVWAACCSYITHNTPPELRTSAQGVLQGLHHGLGRGCGALFGGIFVHYYGTAATFRVYGFICILVLGAFVFINFYRKDAGFVSDIPQTEDPREMAEGTHLAPHGVPGNPMPRALSSSKLSEIAEHGYGTALSGGGDQGGAKDSTNPFLQTGGGFGSGNGGRGGGGGGYNYSTSNINDPCVRQALENSFGGYLFDVSPTTTTIVGNASNPFANFELYNGHCDMNKNVSWRWNENNPFIEKTQQQPPAPFTKILAMQPIQLHSPETYKW